MSKEDRDAAAAAEREEKKRADLLRQQEDEAAREAELAALVAAIDALQGRLDKRTRDADNVRAALRQQEHKLQEEGLRIQQLVEEFKFKQKTIGLLKDKDASMRELKQLSAQSAKRLMELAGEWESHRVPLVEEIRTTKDSVAKRKADMKYKLDRIREMRLEMKRLAHEIREKDELVKQLMEELAKLPKQVQRTGYTQRIMDIMKNIEKQQITIGGILKDTPKRASTPRGRCSGARTHWQTTWCSAPPRRRTTTPHASARTRLLLTFTASSLLCASAWRRRGRCRTRCASWRRRSRPLLPAAPPSMWSGCQRT